MGTTGPDSFDTAASRTPVDLTDQSVWKDVLTPPAPPTTSQLLANEFAAEATTGRGGEIGAKLTPEGTSSSKKANQKAAKRAGVEEEEGNEDISPVVVGSSIAASAKSGLLASGTASAG